MPVIALACVGSFFMAMCCLFSCRNAFVVMNAVRLFPLAKGCFCMSSFRSVVALSYKSPSCFMHSLMVWVSFE